MTKILVIDDQQGMRRSLAILLKKERYQVREAANGQEAIQLLQGNDFGLVITDMKMSPGTGLEVLYYIREKRPTTPVIIMTGYGTVDSAVLAMKMGAFDYVAKPFKNEEILHRVRRSLARAETEKEMAHIKYDEGMLQVPIVGKGTKMKEVIMLVEKMA